MRLRFQLDEILIFKSFHSDCFIMYQMMCRYRMVESLILNQLFLNLKNNLIFYLGRSQHREQNYAILSNEINCMK